MSGLGKWQIVSLVSRFSALFLGLVQSVVIARILTVSEFGLIGIVTAVGALAGVAQHLGLASGTTREISSSPKEDAFKIFVSSCAIKYSIALPLAFLLFISARYLAVDFYKHPEIELPIKLYSLVMVIQGVQSIFNSLIAGLQRFKRLFLYQVAIAVVSVALYVPLVYLYRVNGYFFALVLFNLFGSASLAALALWPIRRSLRAPSNREFTRIFKNVLILSLGIYFVKVLYSIWLKFGQAVLGKIETTEAVGIFSFAALYSSKLMTVSDALTDVNLPVFSKEFVSNFENFKKMFKENFDKVYVFILLAGLSASFFARQIIEIAVGHKYDRSIYLILPLVLSVVAYSYINLIKSSVLIPAKMLVEMIGAYLILLLTSTVVFLLILDAVGALVAVSYAMLAGSFASFFVLGLLIRKRLRFNIVDGALVTFTLYALLLIPAGAFIENIAAKVGFFAVYSFGIIYLVDYLKLFDLRQMLRRIFP